MDQTTQSTAQITPGIDIPYAAAETAAWREFMDKLVSSGQHDRVYSYFIPADDITNVLQSYPGAIGIRTFFALRQGENAQQTLHLYIVPVDENHNDVLDVNGQSVIYDTTMPCPSACGGGNPLNGGVN